MPSVEITLNSISLDSYANPKSFTCSFDASPTTWPSSAQLWCSQTEGTINTPSGVDTITIKLPSASSYTFDDDFPIVNDLNPAAPVPFTTTLSNPKLMTITEQIGDYPPGPWLYTVKIKDINNVVYQHDPMIYNNGSGVIQGAGNEGADGGDSLINKGIDYVKDHIPSI